VTPPDRYEASDYHFINALRAVLGKSPVPRVYGTPKAERQAAKTTVKFPLREAGTVSEAHTTDRLVLLPEFRSVMEKVDLERRGHRGTAQRSGKLFRPKDHSA
jgi:hypothetical protein